MSESQGWKRYTIKENAYLRGRIGWQGLRADEFCLEGPYLVTGTDFDRGRVNWTNCYHVSEARFCEAVPIQLREGDLLVTKDGTIGKIAHVQDCPDQAVLNSGVFLLRCADGSFQHRFLYHVLTSHHFDEFLRQNLAGSTINHLYQYVFENFAFFAPDNAHQERICRILDLIDTQIEMTDALIAKQERVRAGLMQDLFMRGVDEHGQLRPPHEEAPHLYHQTELGLLPKGWEAPKLESLLAPIPTPMRSGPFGSALLKHELATSGIPFLGIDNIHVEHFKSNFIRFVTPVKFAELSRYRVLPDDVVITIMGTVGRCCVIPDGFGEMLSSKHLWTMTFDQSKVLPELVCWQLNHAPWVLSWFRARSQGGIMDAIQSSTLKELRLPLPLMTEQPRILKIYREATYHLQMMRDEVSKLALQKSGLMQDLLTGKVSVASLLERAAA
ncbi:restriction endonuclease subunit S [Bradyrhizobium sp. DOA1]|uniref:restriction endonuclease subunit S n=1 Tax=Bradyrhizobium sp. DOA1 TaxID=1126616 RepID=UPI0009EF3599|nr:restriction endonuclease subunit S [Bradyrhizobium sp. DOA1]